MKRVPIGEISPAQAAQDILAGIAANRSQIVFPFYNRMIVLLYRWLPGVIGRLINTVDT